MPLLEASIMSQRRELLMLAQDRNLAELCRRFGISRVTGYKWLKRFEHEGEARFTDRSRRPTNSPRRTGPELEERILRVRDVHPAWGPHKIRSFLERLTDTPWPSASTIGAILLRHGRIPPEEAAKHRAWQHFERPRPNQLWQMDFKGHSSWHRNPCERQGFCVIV